MNLSIEVMRGVIPRLYLVLVTLALGSAWGGECERGISWWDKHRRACIPCTKCDPTQRSIIKLRCEIHRDAVCQPMDDLLIFPDQNDKDSSFELYSDYEYVDYDSEVTNDDGEVKWDLQTTSLTMAASGCVVFFLVVLILYLYHAKQWKILKQVLKSDVQDLTAKLKLMEAGGDTPAEPVVPTDHHIYCNIHVGKEALLGSTTDKKGLGNVYTQEKHPS